MQHNAGVDHYADGASQGSAPVEHDGGGDEEDALEDDSGFFDALDGRAGSDLEDSKEEDHDDLEVRSYGSNFNFSRGPSPILFDVPAREPDSEENFWMGIQDDAPSRSPSPAASLRLPSPASRAATPATDEELPDADLVDDTLNVEMEDLFDEILDSGDIDHLDERDSHGRPRALSEHPLLRNAYIHVYIASTVHNATKEMTKLMLDGPAMANMARTIGTVQRRLGVDPDRFITYYFICNICWSGHHPRELYRFHSPACPQEGCDGQLFRLKKMTNGKSKRIPLRVLPTTPIIPTIQRMISRPGKLDEWNRWRQEGDGPGLLPPIEQVDWPGSNDPNLRMFDMMDGWGWSAIAAGLKRRRGGEWELEDVDVQGLNQRFVALPMGLVLQMNIDWFRVGKRGAYSVGAVYITVCNNPRAKRFLREETILYCVIPGPTEPTTAQLNHVLSPLVHELRKLYNGAVTRRDDPQLAHGYLNNNCSDLPAAHKVNGLRGHTSHDFMCDVCTMPFNSLVSPDCFDPTKFVHRNDWRFLKYAFRWREADEDGRTEIVENRGVEWSILNLLPGWLPMKKSPSDMMHGAYLAQFVFSTDLPKLVTGGSGKADQWRNLATVLVVGLYVAWQEGGQVPDKNAPLPKSTTKVAKKRERVEELLNKRHRAAVAAEGGLTDEEMAELASLHMDRNYRRHFETIMEWSTAIRIYGSQSITVEETMRAADAHARACQSWVRMFCHLVPYFHILMHLWMWILLLGPVYGWWTYPYGRANGYLSRIKHNGKTGTGEIESTLMRGWTKMLLIHELIMYLEDLGDAKTPEDEDAICKLREVLKGTQTEFARFPQKVPNLRKLNLYTRVFEYLQDLWRDTVTLIIDTATGIPGESFVATAIASYSHVRVSGIKYGASTSPRGRGCSYAYMDGRQAVRIDHLFRIVHPRQDPRLPSLETTCAVVCPFVADGDLPEMPWAPRASDLGIGTWHAHILGDHMVIDAKMLSGQFALAEVSHPMTDLWITISLCHNSQEPELVDNEG
ncbi:hypothetical protein OH76DRAFT_1458045 [Lentinus brumalis]|uniref:Uncharacterized protein n=1 Tax=Lentinus brumalis TaxID=2498619 RepID=A0A371CVR9_9APHY|nr:hypothetical protein OH76DRAFT_1458045 [Polyporus brumalis]